MSVTSKGRRRWGVVKGNTELGCNMAGDGGASVTSMRDRHTNGANVIHSDAGDRITARLKRFFRSHLSGGE